MRTFLTSIFCLAASLLASAECLAQGLEPAPRAVQPPAVSPDPAKDRAAATAPKIGAVQEAELETYYLKNEKGELVPVIEALTYEEFRKLYNRYKGLDALPDQLPKFGLEKIVIAADVSEGRAMLDAEFTFMVALDGWVRIPLRLPSAILLSTPAHEGEGEQFMEYLKDDGGYVAWIRAPADTRHTLTLKMVVPVAKVSGETRLALDVPRCGDSQLVITADGAQLTPSPIEGAVISKPQPVAGGRTKFEVRQPGGQFAVAWRDAAEPGTEAPTLLEAVGTTVLVKFDGQRHISSEARLKVRPLNGVFSAFQVRLPPAMKLTPQSQQLLQQRFPETEIVDEKEGESGKSGGSQLVKIKLPAPTADVVELPLVAQAVPSGARTDQPLEAAGFEVLGAVEQKGYIDLAVQSDWSVHCIEGPNVRRVGDVPEPQRQEGVTTRYEFFRQPCSLKVQVLEKRIRISVEPTYLVYIGADEIHLDARFNYKIRGAKVDELKIDMGDWQVDDVVPWNLVQDDSIDLTKTTPLKVPLATTAQAAMGDFELRISARRDTAGSAPESMASGLQELAFLLPRPEASTLLPASVVVLPADNIELLPRHDELQGLSVESSAPAVKLPTTWQTPRFYRDRGDEPQSRFVSDFKVHGRSVAVSVASHVRLDEQTAHVEQSLSYRIDYQALSSLVLNIPESLLKPGIRDSDKLAISLDGEALKLHPLDSGASGESAADGSHVQVNLQPARIGLCEFLVRYTLPLTDLKPEQNIAVAIPLVMPAASGETEIISNRMRVTASEALRIEPIQGQWETAGADVLASGQNEWELQSEESTAELPLAVMLERQQNQSTSVIAQAWVQTWLTAADRRDRAVFRLTTSEARLLIQLPAGVRQESIDATLTMLGSTDASPVRLATGSAENGKIAVDLPANELRRTYVVELWYSFLDGRPQPGAMTIEIPRLVGALPPKRFYWQLVLPPQENLLFAPDELTPELTWRWQGMYWGRRASLPQADLEKWIGASQQTRLPDGVGQYLYSSFTPIENIEIHTSNRALIVLAASLPALLAGLILVYLPATRHPGVLFVAGLALLTGGLIYPELAFLLGQAAVVGLVLALVAQVLGWVVGRRREGRSVIRGSSMTSLDSQVTESRAAKLENASQVSTTSAPLMMHASVTEGKP